MNFVPVMAAFVITALAAWGLVYGRGKLGQAVGLSLLLALGTGGTGILLDSWNGIYLLFLGTPFAFMVGAILGAWLPPLFTPFGDGEEGGGAQKAGKENSGE